MFAGTARPGRLRRANADRNTAAGLAASLRNAGHRVDGPAVDRLGEITAPVLAAGRLGRRERSSSGRRAVAAAVSGSATRRWTEPVMPPTSRRPTATIALVRAFLGTSPTA